jgi:CBS domain-containing protein
VSETQLVADVMLRDPKTLAADATVGEVREQLDNPRVQMVLLTDGQTFRGAVTALPTGAAPTDLALLYSDECPDSIAPDASAGEAFERAVASPTRRVLVLDEDGNLLGLLCLDPTRTRFCGKPDVSF